MSVCPSACMERLGSHWTDFLGINILVFLKDLLGKSKIQIYCYKDNHATNSNLGRGTEFNKIYRRFLQSY
jgi:hypothetical protein